MRVSYTTSQTAILATSQTTLASGIISQESTIFSPNCSPGSKLPKTSSGAIADIVSGSIVSLIGIIFTLLYMRIRTRTRKIETVLEKYEVHVRPVGVMAHRTPMSRKWSQRKEIQRRWQREATPLSFFASLTKSPRQANVPTPSI